MSETGLVVDELAVRLGQANILLNVCLRVGPGEIVGLVGSNGVGKTTTLRAISGLVSRKQGALRVDGRTLPARASRVAAMGIAHVPEGRGLIPTMTARDNLRLACVATRRRLTAAELDSACEVFPALAALLDKQAGLLSGGEAQMVAIARGMVTTPRVLMVDELSLGLAPKLVGDLLGAIVSYGRANQVGLLLVDQNVRALLAVCDRVHSIKHGRSSLMPKDGGEAEIRSVYFDY